MAAVARRATVTPPKNALELAQFLRTDMLGLRMQDAGCGLQDVGCTRDPHYSSLHTLYSLSVATLIQNGHERFLRNVDLSDRLHAFFSFTLLRPKFPFACNIAAVTFGCHVFA